MPRLAPNVLRAASGVALLALLQACSPLAGPGPQTPDRREVAVAVTQSNQLIRFNAARPDRLLSRRPLTGLQPGEQVLGLDYRAKGDVLYALGSSQRLYTVDVDSGAVTAVGAPFAIALQGSDFGFDFNPAVDRIRVVSDRGQNLRLHPDTAAVVDAQADQPGLQTDAATAFDAGDRQAKQAARVVAAAYSYNKADPKMTTNFAIDAATGTLVTQGSREGLQPAVSPNSGRLFTVGALGAGPFSDASFDIHAVTDQAFAALTATGAGSSRWVQVDLLTGAARPIGLIAGGEAVRAMALQSW